MQGKASALEPITPYKTDPIYNFFMIFIKGDPCYMCIFYFAFSYAMIYAIGLITGQFHGLNGLKPMYSYALDNLCIGFLAPLGAGLIVNLYNKIYETTGVIIKKKIIGDDEIEMYGELLAEFDKKYNNYFYSILGILISALISLYIYFFRESSWLGIRGGLTGAFETFVIFINFSMIITVIYKCIITIWLLQRVLAFNIKIQPVHPDRAGGLKHIGGLAMAVNYFLILVMLFFTLLLVFDTFARQFVVIYLLFYIFTFFAFFASLYEAHKKMKKVKEEALERLEITSDFYYNKLKAETAGGGTYDLDSADEIIMVDNLYVIVEKMPVWPFDFNHIIKFMSAFLTPFLIFVVSLFVNADSILYHFDMFFGFFKK